MDLCRQKNGQRIAHLWTCIIQFFVSPFYSCSNCRIEGNVQEQKILKTVVWLRKQRSKLLTSLQQSLSARILSQNQEKQRNGVLRVANHRKRNSKPTKRICIPPEGLRHFYLQHVLRQTEVVPVLIITEHHRKIQNVFYIQGMLKRIIYSAKTYELPEILMEVLILDLSARQP